MVILIFLGLRMNRLAVGDEPPDEVLLLWVCFRFDWLISDGSVSIEF